MVCQDVNSSDTNYHFKGYQVYYWVSEIGVSATLGKLQVIQLLSTARSSFAPYDVLFPHLHSHLYICPFVF